MGTINLRRFGSRHEWLDAAANLLAERMTRSFGRPHAVMLSGGETPRPVYAEIAQRGLIAADDLFVLFSDERMVARESPDSNFGAADGMLRALGVPEERVLSVHTDLGLKAAAVRYDCDMRQFFKSGGRITLGLLGLGADGHTASLFTARDARQAGEALAVPVPQPVKPDRVSVTPALIRRVETIVFLVLGKEKSDVVKKLLQDPGSLPAGLAVREAPNVQLWVA